MMQLQVAFKVLRTESKVQHGQQHFEQKQLQHLYQRLQHTTVKMFKSNSIVTTKHLFCNNLAPTIF
jgi:hypothetical protein